MKNLIVLYKEGAQILNNHLCLIIQTAYSCKIEAQIENMILSLCRATNRIYIIMIHKTAHVT
jgi:hypothetical protein